MTDTKKSGTASDDIEKRDETAADAEKAERVETGTADIEDAEVVDESVEASPEGDKPETAADELPVDEAEGSGKPVEPEETTGADPDDDTVDPEDIADLETLDGVRSGDTLETEAEPEPVPDQAEPADAAPVSTETVVVERRGAIVPGFLGGAIAATGLVFAAPFVIPAKYMPVNPAVQQALEAQSTTITAMRAELATMGSKFNDMATAADLSALRAESANLEASLQAAMEDMASNEALSDVAAQIDAFTDRVSALEKRPIAEAPDPASVAAVEAYGREVADLRETVTSQMKQADELVKSAAAAADAAVQQALAASSAAVADAEAAEEDAAEKALRAARAQALVDIQAALETGAAYESVLPSLDGISVPPALAAAAGGVATLPDLRDEFTLAAREALATSRSETAGDGVGSRASTWIQNQLGLRSLSPTEGDSPDAVLSRAEAALVEARLTDAVAELSALPEGGQQIMANWVAKATTRAEALAAADELAASLAAN